MNVFIVREENKANGKDSVCAFSTFDLLTQYHPEVKSFSFRIRENLKNATYLSSESQRQVTFSRQTQEGKRLNDKSLFDTVTVSFSEIVGG